jgi:hypothetical protein
MYAENLLGNNIGSGYSLISTSIAVLAPTFAVKKLA